MRLLVTLCLPILSHSAMALTFDCLGSDEVNFRGHFSIEKYEHRQEYLGSAHSFAILKEPSVKDCRVPWYEKFEIRAEERTDHYLHKHEYAENCILVLKLPRKGNTVEIWVEDPNGSRLSTPIRRECANDA